MLASVSPRRRELLAQIALAPDLIDGSGIDETPRRGELPGPHALRLAGEKLAAVMPRHPDAFIVAADTVVACGRRILPKPEDAETERHCLELLSGRRHRVMTGVAVAAPGAKPVSRLVTTIVAFKRLTRDEIGDYVASGEGIGKAGGYAIQGLGARFIRAIHGSYSNVVGLPLFETASLLAGQGFARARRLERDA